jgi:Flp pilus assembly protein TadD
VSQAQHSRSAFLEAIELINAGRSGQAESLCRAFVEQYPKDINMTALLGATLFKTRQFEEAETWLRSAIRLAPSFAKPHTDLGMLLLEVRRIDEARLMLETACRLDGSDEMAWFNLGRVRALQGEGKAADEAFEKSFELNPARKSLALAAEHRVHGRMKEAEALCREVLQAEPGNVDALRLLASCAAVAGRLHQAERRLLQALELAPDYVEARLDLGGVYKEQHRLEDAITQFRAAIRLEPANHMAHFQLGAVLAPAAQTDAAIAAYRRVVQLRPQHAGAWLGLGHTLKTAGHQIEAVAAYRECIRLKPGKGETYWSLANLKTYQLSDEDIAAMQAQLARPELSQPEHAQSNVNFRFALAKAFEDRADYETAWTHYREGNQAQRMQEHYDPVRNEVLHDQLVEVFSHSLLREKGGDGHPSEAPIFIIGLPRSGSTLLEQILASHSQVEGTAELPYIGMVSNSLSRNRADGVNYPQAVRELDGEHFRQLGQDYLDLARIHRVEDRPRFIDKRPNNFPAVGFIHLAFPNATIIDARRYPLDSTLSCYRQLFARGQSFTYDLTDIGEYYLEYERMLDHWHSVLPGRVLTVQYEELVTDFESQVRRILAHCRLPFEEACLRFWETDRPVRTASSEQVRQPVYTGSVNRWRRYAHHLGELQEVLEPVLGRYAQFEPINR